MRRSLRAGVKRSVCDIRHAHRLQPKHGPLLQRHVSDSSRHESPGGQHQQDADVFGDAFASRRTQSRPRRRTARSRSRRHVTDGRPKSVDFRSTVAAAKRL